MRIGGWTRLVAGRFHVYTRERAARVCVCERRKQQRTQLKQKHQQIRSTRAFRT
jgi:hypothetical protein